MFGLAGSAAWAAAGGCSEMRAKAAQVVAIVFCANEEREDGRMSVAKESVRLEGRRTVTLLGQAASFCGWPLAGREYFAGLRARVAK